MNLIRIFQNKNMNYIKTENGIKLCKWNSNLELYNSWKGYSWIEATNSYMIIDGNFVGWTTIYHLINCWIQTLYRWVRVDFNLLLTILQLNFIWYFKCFLSIFWHSNIEWYSYVLLLKRKKSIMFCNVEVGKFISPVSTSIFTILFSFSFQCFIQTVE